MGELTKEEILERQREGGRKGGLAKVPKGFAKNPELAKKAGEKGRANRYNKEQ